MAGIGDWFDANTNDKPVFTSKGKPILTFVYGGDEKAQQREPQTRVVYGPPGYNGMDGRDGEVVYVSERADEQWYKDNITRITLELANIIREDESLNEETRTRFISQLPPVVAHAYGINHTTHEALRRGEKTKDVTKTLSTGLDSDFKKYFADLLKRAHRRPNDEKEAAA